MAKSIVVNFIGDDKDLKNAFDRSEAHGSKWAGALKTIGKAAAAGLVVAGAAAVKVGVDLTKLGMQLDSQERKAKVVFGEGIKDVQAWASAHANAMGLSKRELIDLAAATQDLLIPMGFQRDKALDITKQLTNLSGALSLWTGGQRTANEVSGILTKALLGEREELKSLGISIAAVDVENRMAKDGTDQLTGAAFYQAEAMTTLNLIMEKSVDAQTSAAAGAHKLTEAKLRLTGAFKDFRDNVALSLINHVLPGIAQGFAGGSKGGADFADKLGNLSTWVETHGPEIREWATNFGKDLRTIVDTLGKIIGAAGKVWEVIQKIDNALDFLPFFGEPLIDPKYLPENQPKPKKVPFVEPAGSIPRFEARAHGGPVTGGTPYLVGERGPEMFRPTTSGMIAPGGGWGGMTLNIYNAGSVVTERDLETTVVRILSRAGIRNVSALGGLG